MSVRLERVKHAHLRRPSIARRPVASERTTDRVPREPVVLASSLIDLSPTKCSRRSSAHCSTPTTPPASLSLEHDEPRHSHGRLRQPPKGDQFSRRRGGSVFRRRRHQAAPCGTYAGHRWLRRLASGGIDRSSARGLRMVPPAHKAQQAPDPGLVERRGRDSNPRSGVAGLRFSRPVHSTALPPLRETRNRAQDPIRRCARGPRSLVRPAISTLRSNPAGRGGRVAEGTRLLSEYGAQPPSRVRIPPSPLYTARPHCARSSAG
jgi:hypothetical protein